MTVSIWANILGKAIFSRLTYFPSVAFYSDIKYFVLKIQLAPLYFLSYKWLPLYVCNQHR